MSRCQSISSELQLAGKHLSVSSNDLYFANGPIPSPASNAYRQAASPIWSDTYEDLRPVTTAEDSNCNLPPDRLLTAQMANSMALGYGNYNSLTRPRWSTTLARSMDCLYSTAISVAPSDAQKTLQQSQRCFSQISTTAASCNMDNEKNLRSLTMSNESPYGCRRPEQRKIHAIIHHERNSDVANDKEQVTYGRATRPPARRQTTTLVSDSESSSSSGGGTGQQQEIYESSSTNSSNSSSGVSNISACTLLNFITNQCS